MATTAQTLIDETRRLLLSGQREERNTLAANVSAGAASPLTLTFTYPIINTGIQAGARLAIGLENFYVWSVSATAQTASVQRAEDGSAAAAHTSGDIVRINPKFSDFEIFTAINEDLADLSANGLYQVKTLDLTYNASVQGYDFTGTTGADVLGILEVRAKSTGATANWPVIGPGQYSLLRNMATTEFASGTALVLYASGWPGNAVHVRYKAPFVAFTATTDDAQSVAKLAATMNDLPPLGAAIRLMAPREVKRNFTDAQGDPRRAEEVPPGAVLNSMRGLQLLRAQRISLEASRLGQEWPIRLAM